jgi:hypothetical protein
MEPIYKQFPSILEASSTIGNLRTPHTVVINKLLALKTSTFIRKITAFFVANQAYYISM